MFHSYPTVWCRLAEKSIMQLGYKKYSQDKIGKSYNILWKIKYSEIGKVLQTCKKSDLEMQWSIPLFCSFV